MPIPKDITRPQIKLDTGTYGSLPWEGMPEGDGSTDAQIFYWHRNSYGGGQWVAATLIAGAGMDIDYDPDTGILSITNRDYRVYASVSMDAMLMIPISGTFTARSIVKGTLEGTFTADAELV